MLEYKVSLDIQSSTGSALMQACMAGSRRHRSIAVACGRAHGSARQNRRYGANDRQVNGHDECVREFREHIMRTTEEARRSKGGGHAGGQPRLPIRPITLRRLCQLTCELVMVILR